MVSLSDLPSLQTLGDLHFTHVTQISIYNCPSLVDLTAFSGITTLALLDISNSYITNLSAFDSLTSISDMTLVDMHALKRLNFPRLQHILGSIFLVSGDETLEHVVEDIGAVLVPGHTYVQVDFTCGPHGTPVFSPHIACSCDTDYDDLYCDRHDGLACTSEALHSENYYSGLLTGVSKLGWCTISFDCYNFTLKTGKNMFENITTIGHWMLLNVTITTPPDQFPVLINVADFIFARTMDLDMTAFRRILGFNGMLISENGHLRTLEPLRVSSIGDIGTVIENPKLHNVTALSSLQFLGQSLHVYDVSMPGTGLG
jgi:hypothetical protein